MIAAGIRAGEWPAGTDAAIGCYVLCTVPDQDLTLAEVAGSCGPSGQLCFLEHARADSIGFATGQRVIR